jgi:hypothetical protein
MAARFAALSSSAHVKQYQLSLQMNQHSLFLPSISSLAAPAARR